ncbi:MAG: Coq4 family protein [Cyanobacteria bacterium P01_G01_bin.49]
MATIKRLVKAYKDYFTKGETGDAALLESELYGWGANPTLVAQLQAIAGYYPKIDLEQLSQLPQGTLGYEYAQHMKKNKIQPLEISEDLRSEAERHPFALRYTITHDIFHILLGFDTSYVGEMGVFGFTVGQNYSKALNLVYPLIKLIFSIIKPRQTQAILASARRGKEFGQQASCLLVYRFEENWERPIADIRAELGLVLADEQLDREPDRAIAKVLSQESVVA